MEPRDCLTKRVCIVALLVFLASGMLALVTGNRLRYADERAYDRLADSLLEGRGYSAPSGEPTAYRPPGYPLALAACYAVVKRPIAGKVLNSAALAAVAGLSYAVCAAESTIAPIPFALAFLLFQPMAVYAAATLYPQVLAGLLLLVSLVFLFRSQKTCTAFTAGLTYGAAILVSAGLGLLCPAILVAIGLHRRNRTKPSRVAALFLLGTCLAVAPWTIRNAVVFGTFVPVSTNSGINLLLGNSPNAGPSSGTNADVSSYRREAAARHLDEVERDIYFRSAALRWISDHPTKAVTLYAAKVLNHFNYENQLATKRESKSWKFLLVAATYYPMLLAVIAGTLLGLRSGFNEFERALLLVYFLAPFLFAIFFTRLRFRIPLDFLLFILFARVMSKVLAARRHAALEDPGVGGH